RWLIRYNKRRLARLTGLKRHADVYTLSLRLQLKENIRSMRKIEFGVYLLIVGLAAFMVLVFAPILFLTSPSQFEILQWLTCLGNIAFALFSKKAAVLRNEMDDYFNQLDSQWSNVLRANITR
ncbi:hypothetical protein PENTCL1PPCAC_15845, partial [Pristionchus entomophagus]